MRVSPSALIFLTVLGLCGAVFAQEGEAWYMGKIIREIRFEGLRNVSRNDVDSVVRPFQGKEFSDQLFRDLQAALYNLDYFEGFIRPEVQKGDPQGNTLVLIFHVQEKPAIHEIRFEGNSRFSASELRDQVVIKTGEILVDSKVRQDESKLRQFYLEKGYPQVRVSSTVQRLEGQNRVIVTFRIEEGAQTLVRTIAFEGVSQVSVGSLREVLKTREQGFLSSGVFQEANLVADRQALQQYYWRLGFVDARVLEIRRESEVDAQQNRVYLKLTYVLQEGQQFTFGGVEFEGNSLFSAEELRGQVRLAPGQIFNKEVFDADYSRILDLYFENGYVYNSFDRVERRVDNTIYVTIRITERPRARIENIIVRGNTKTQEHVILREIPLEPGDVFSKTKIIQGLRNLNNLQYFKAITPETPPGSVEGLVDLIINVEEGNTAEIMFGLSFSGATDFPVSGNFKWQDRNFLGRGLTFGIDLNVSPVQQSLAFNFTEPWAFDQRLSLSTSLNIGHHRRSNIEQDVVFPLYSDRYLPDPYELDVWVFTEPTTIGSITYQPGQVFPGVPTEAQIAQYKLKRQYDWDREKGLLKSGQNTMTLDEWSFSLGIGTGYSFFTPYGRFIVGSGINTALQYITYDGDVYRPASVALRQNFNQWLFENSLYFRAFWDTRDFIYNPEMGTLLGGIYTITGGFLSGAVHYTRLALKAEGNYRLFRLPLVDWYTFRVVARARSVMSFVMNPLGPPFEVVAQPKHLLFIDGMTAGRGWRPTVNLQNGFAAWTNSFELRLPAVENFLWFDIYLDSFVFRQQGISLFPIETQDWYFSYGFGLRITNPQLPLGFYLGKPFRLGEDGNLIWEKGDGIFGSDIDFRLVITFGMDLY